MRLRLGPIVDRFITPTRETSPPGGALASVALNVLSVQTEVYPASIEFALEPYDPGYAYPVKSVHVVGFKSGELTGARTPRELLTSTAGVLHTFDATDIRDGRPNVLDLPRLEDATDYVLFTIIEDAGPESE